MERRSINSFDIDGVIFMGPRHWGVFPGPGDIIVTGRSHEEQPETTAMLRGRGILNRVYFNPLPFDSKTKVSSAQHKARTLNGFRENSEVLIGIHFEDDPVQIAVIRELCPWLAVVHLDHPLVIKDNHRNYVF